MEINGGYWEEVLERVFYLYPEDYDLWENQPLEVCAAGRRADGSCI